MTSRRVVLLLMVALLASITVTAANRWRRGLKAASDLNRATLVHDGVQRRLGWYTGAAVGPSPAPVVLLLHGGGGSTDRVWSQDLGRAWRRLADEHRLVLLLPEGRSDPGDPDAHHWNDCRSDVLEPDAASVADDVGLLRAAVAWAAARWPVDRGRIYVTGASNGGMMSYRLAMQAPDLVAAAAAMIANLPEAGECAGPFWPVPMLIMNGTEDPLMPSEGGCVVSPACQRGRVRSTADTVSFWVGVNQTRSEPVCSDLADTAPGDGSTVTLCTWGGGIRGTEVVLYRVDGGGHSPPGPEPLSLWYRLIAGPKNHDISAADEIWAFFERHRHPPPPPRRPAGRVGR